MFYQKKKKRKKRIRQKSKRTNDDRNFLKDQELSKEYNGHSKSNFLLRYTKMKARPQRNRSSQKFDEDKKGVCEPKRSERNLVSVRCVGIRGTRGRIVGKQDRNNATTDSEQH